MLSTGNQREDSQYPELWSEEQLAAEAEHLPVVRPDTDAIGELLGDFPRPMTAGALRRGTWKLMRWLLVLVLLTGISVPGYLWLEQQSRQVISKNAAVRAHLADVGTRLRGIVAEVLVDVGDRVQAGQVLVRLDARHLQAAVDEAHAEVASLERKIEVERVAVDLQGKEIAQRRIEAAAITSAAEANTEAAEIASDGAKRDFQRLEQLFQGKGIVPGEEVREAEFTWRAAEARLKEARATAVVAVQKERKEIRLAETALSLREQQIPVLQAELSRTQARLTRAEADLAGAIIRAPQDGAVIRRIVEPGVSVEAGAPLLALWLGDEVWVEAWIEEEQLAHAQIGVKARVTFQSFPEQEFLAEITKIGLATDLEVPEANVPRPRSTRMRGSPVVNVQLRLLEPPPQLLPGLSAVVAIDKKVENGEGAGDGGR